MYEKKVLNEIMVDQIPYEEVAVTFKSYSLT